MAVAQPATAGAPAAADSTKKSKAPNHTGLDRVSQGFAKLVVFPVRVAVVVAGGSLLMVDRLNQGFGGRGAELVPVYAPRSGGGFMLSRKSQTGDARFGLTATWGLHGRGFYRARISGIGLLPGFVANLSAHFRDLSDEKFFGIGPKTLHGGETDYRREHTRLDATIGRELTDSFRADVIVGYERNHVVGGEDDDTPQTTDFFTDATLPGIGRRSMLGHVALALRLDTTNGPTQPTRGIDVAVRGSYYDDVDTDLYRFTAVSADVKAYLPLFYERALMLRVAGRSAEAQSGRAVPFYYLSELGETGSIRGFDRGRFRDKSMALASLEYRFPILKRKALTLLFDGVIFGDAGQVSSDFADIDGEDIMGSVGAGLRIWKKSGLRSRLDVAYSVDDWKVHFMFNLLEEANDY
jgi:outer membrane protein assembly factor BamA